MMLANLLGMKWQTDGVKEDLLLYFMALPTGVEPVFSD